MAHGSLPVDITILEVPVIEKDHWEKLVWNKGQFIMTYFKNISYITGVLYKCSKKSQADKFQICLITNKEWSQLSLWTVLILQEDLYNKDVVSSGFWFGYEVAFC